MLIVSLVVYSAVPPGVCRYLFPAAVNYSGFTASVVSSFSALHFPHLSLHTHVFSSARVCRSRAVHRFNVCVYG